MIKISGTWRVMPELLFQQWVWVRRTGTDKGNVGLSGLFLLKPKLIWLLSCLELVLLLLSWSQLFLLILNVTFRMSLGMIVLLPSSSSSSSSSPLLLLLHLVVVVVFRTASMHHYALLSNVNVTSQHSCRLCDPILCC